MSTVLVIGLTAYGIGGMWTALEGWIMYSLTLRYPMLREHEWEKQHGARLMVFAPVWPIYLLAVYAGPFGRSFGRTVGQVWKVAMKR